MKKSLFPMFVMIAIVLSACAPAIHGLGGYTGAEYGAQATQIAKDAAAAKTQADTISGLDAQVKSLVADKGKLIDEETKITADEVALQSKLDNYQKMICTDRTWDEMMNKITVYQISKFTQNADLAKLESDTKVSFYLTQWLPIGTPADDALGYYMLTVDNYNGVALESKVGCVILDPAKWDVAK